MLDQGVYLDGQCNQVDYVGVVGDDQGYVVEGVGGVCVYCVFWVRWVGLVLLVICV